jgi:hypothetical protein
MRSEDVLLHRFTPGTVPKEDPEEEGTWGALVEAEINGSIMTAFLEFESAEEKDRLTEMFRTSIIPVPLDSIGIKTAFTVGSSVGGNGYDV